MKVCLFVIALLVIGGCSQNEMHDPTATKATVLMDSTGTAQQVTAQIAAQKP